MGQIIHIFGASGSGTSTLGRTVSERLGYAFMDTDDYFWMPTDPRFTVKRPREERLRLIKRDLSTAENAVLSGSLIGWGDELIPLFTLAVRLETDTDIRIARLERRERERFGSRVDLDGDMFSQHQDFISWAKDYDTGPPTMRSRACHDLWQRKLPCRLLMLNGADSVDANFEAVQKALGTGIE